MKAWLTCRCEFSLVFSHYYLFISFLVSMRRNSCEEIRDLSVLFNLLSVRF